MLGVCVAALVGLILVIIYFLRWRGGNLKVVYVVVLGDIGRSPRMQYHALSLVDAGFKVFLIGFPGSRPHNDIVSNSSIQIIYLFPLPKCLKGLPSPINFLVQVIEHAVVLLSSLLYHPRPSHILVQNPPSVPGIFVSWLACKIRGAQLIVDWHNYGYTIMALVVNEPTHPLVKIYKLYEKLMSSCASKNICVTESMRKDLMENWGVSAVTLYDRAPAIFKKLNLQERHQFFNRCKVLFEANEELTNSFTIERTDGDVCYRKDRPALLVSSTSWTPDEDFSILFNALDCYNKAAENSLSCLPSILCVITGKGPLKDFYTSLIQKKNWQKIRVITPWLEAEDYPCLLGSADLGVCLHTSSSGLDLPMKVVDMFGCQLPVCAVSYECVTELVTEDVTGVTFKTSDQLSGHLTKLLRNFPDGCEKLDVLRRNLENSKLVGWKDNWNANVANLFV